MSQNKSRSDASAREWNSPILVGIGLLVVLIAGIALAVAGLVG